MLEGCSGVAFGWARLARTSPPRADFFLLLRKPDKMPIYRQLPLLRHFPSPQIVENTTAVFCLIRRPCLDSGQTNVHFFEKRNAGDSAVQSSLWGRAGNGYC